MTFTACPDCGGSRLNEAARSSKIGGDQHRRRVRDADQRPVRVGARPRRAVGGAAARRAATDPRLVRRDRAGLPQPRPAVGDAVGRRVAARQDDPAPRVVAHRRDLRVRRADDRAAPARHRADERLAAAAPRQGQHRARRRAQAGGDRHRRPRRRSRPRRGRGRWRDRVRGHRRSVAGQRHADRPASRRPGRPQSDRADADRHAPGARRRHEQPAGRRRRHPARRTRGRHRRGRVGEELADPRLGLGPGRRGVGRPGRDQGLAAQQPGDLHRTARPDPQDVRQGQRSEARAVQRQLRRRLPQLQRQRRHLHRPRDDGGRCHRLRRVRGEALPGRGARVRTRREGHQRSARDVGHRRRRRSSPTATRTLRPRTRSSPDSPTSGSDT